MELSGRGNDAPLIDYTALDVAKTLDKDDAVRKADVAGPAPSSSSWQNVYVKFPSRLALTTAICIIIYEILVLTSMWVRVLRFVMVYWLMYVLLAINLALLLALAIIVFRSKKDVSISGLVQTGLNTAKGISIKGGKGKRRHGQEEELGPDHWDDSL
jgi:hypothetical protein